MPGTTPLGFPYPLPTEPVAEGAAAIRTLAEADEGRAIRVARAAGFFTWSAADQNSRAYAPALTQEFSTLGGTPFSTGRFIAPIAGIYRIGLYVGDLAIGRVSIALSRFSDGAQFKRVTRDVNTGADGFKGGIETEAMLSLAAGNGVSLFGWASSGGANNTIAYEVVRLGPTPASARPADGDAEPPADAIFA